MHLIANSKCSTIKYNRITGNCKISCSVKLVKGSSINEAHFFSNHLSPIFSAFATLRRSLPHNIRTLVFHKYFKKSQLNALKCINKQGCRIISAEHYLEFLELCLDVKIFSCRIDFNSKTYGKVRRSFDGVARVSFGAKLFVSQFSLTFVFTQFSITRLL